MYACIRTLHRISVKCTFFLFMYQLIKLKKKTLHAVEHTVVLPIQEAEVG